MFVTPFTLALPDDRLADLRLRLLNARWPRVRAGSGWSMGLDDAVLRRAVAYWLGEYNWRAQQDLLNRLPQFTTQIDGLTLHFVHLRSRGEDAIPLLLAPGWPCTFSLYTELLPRLADPARFGADPAPSFDVVLPALPGFPFSDAFPTGGPRSRIADLWHELMVETLGYPKFASAGGDIGSDILTRLALQHPRSLLGLHLTDVRDPWLGPRTAPLTLAEQTYRSAQDRWLATEGGYDRIQTTKPQALAYAFNDSPLGALAWLLEKFHAWSDCDGDLEKRFTLDQLLTNATLFLATDTLATSLHLYYDRLHHAQPLVAGEFVQVPTAVALFPADGPTPPREWAERAYNIHRWSALPRGGHFPFLEEPDLYAQDLRAFFAL